MIRTTTYLALLGLLALCLGVCVLAGCYTTLRHPVTADLPDDYTYHEKSCYDCHDEASFYHAQYGVYYNYYGDPWFGYYSDPWWYDTYWHDDAPLPRTHRSDDRHQWGRGIPSGAPRGRSGSGASPYLREGYTKKSSKPDQPPAKAEKPKEEKKTDKSRRSYGRGKKK